MVEASLVIVNHQTLVSTNHQYASNRRKSSIRTLLPFMGTLGNNGSVGNKNYISTWWPQKSTTRRTKISLVLFYLA